MTLDTVCAGCGQKYRLPAELAGRKAKCKSCGHAMTIEAAAVAVAAKAAKPTLQAFGAAPAPRARPPLQSFGSAPAAPRPAPSAGGAMMEFEEVSDDDAPSDDPYGLDDAPALPSKANSRSDDFDEEMSASPIGPGRPGRTGQAKKSKARYATFWKRTCAFVVDWLILVLMQGVVGFVAGFVIGFQRVTNHRPLPTKEEMAGVNLVITLACLAVWMLINAYAIASGEHASMGKRAMKIRILGDDRKPIGLGRAILREFTKVFSFLMVGVGCIMAAFTPQKQGMHDMIARTVVLEA